MIKGYDLAYCEVHGEFRGAMHECSKCKFEAKLAKAIDALKQAREDLRDAIDGNGISYDAISDIREVLAELGEGE